LDSNLQQGNENRRLHEQVAIITGAGRGIGEAIALSYAEEGARLVLAARTVIEIERVAQAIRTKGATAIVVRTDVTDPLQVKFLIQRTIQEFGQADILVNAAGVYGPIGLTWEVDPKAWTAAFEVNLFGTFYLCQAVLPHMIAARRGRIINFSGGGATSPLPRFTAYGVSKAAVVRLTETLAEEVREFGIRINAIAPGAVDTKLQDEVLTAGERAGDLFTRIQQMRESGRGATPREVPAALAVFLASEASRNLTGRLIAAPHDGWETWSEDRISAIMSQAWFTLRRLDPFTLRPLVPELQSALAVSKGK